MERMVGENGEKGQGVARPQDSLEVGPRVSSRVPPVAKARWGKRKERSGSPLSLADLI